MEFILFWIRLNICKKIRLSNNICKNKDQYTLNRIYLLKIVINFHCRYLGIFKINYYSIFNVKSFIIKSIIDSINS
jgi:hypothetical protein